MEIVEVVAQSAAKPAAMLCSNTPSAFAAMTGLPNHGRIQRARTQSVLENPVSQS
jgi:hypothetical protein